ncbi:hypothetical protein I7X12_00130 [Halosimplex litoreum]|uniref:Uncharacterized protein n=1 Tax=Halosimplex litoreum TaxID=1198301 RepID=A0A7T3FYM0_9EURY|nr:hypothetical protein [Halosimplex litoreum]QPV63080.1 hypothetical protein I7X12_00130 [Halosimplex litoreum]
MPEGEYHGYTAGQLRIIAGTTIALTLAPLVFSPVDGWNLHRFAFALGCGTLAALTGLAFHRL